MGISSDLQRVIVARLKAAVPAVAGRVYDGPREDAQMPYISIGASYWTDDSAECIRARVETVQVDVWASNRPDKSACKVALDEAARAIDGWSNEAVLTAHPLRVFSAQVRDDPDGMTVHGFFLVDAMVEEDG